MNTYRRTAIIVAALFLGALFVDIIASSMYSPILKAPDWLVSVYPKKTMVTIGVLLDFVCAPAMIFIPIMLFPVLKMFNERIALGYVVFRLFEGILFTVMAIDSLSLISLSRDYINSGTQAASYFQALGNSIHARIVWGASVYILVFTVGAIMFYYLLFISTLIPRWLSGWGLLASVFLSAGALLHMFGMFGNMPLMKAMAFFAPPIALNETVLSIWLIVKGFNPSSIALKSVPLVESNETRR